jgi:hypothetical protein
MKFLKEFFVKDQVQKFGWAVVLIIAGFIVNQVLAGYQAREISIESGLRAKQENELVHPQIVRQTDSICRVVNKITTEIQTNRVVDHQNDSFVKFMLIEMKQDLKEIKRERR